MFLPDNPNTLFILGIFITLIGVALKQSEVVVFGVTYMVMPFFMIFLYGLLGMLSGLIYNFLSKKFGGLELTIEEDNQGQH